MSIFLPQTEKESSWSSAQRVLFRFLFLYLILQAVPLDWKYFRQLFSLDWNGPWYANIFLAAHYAPHFAADGQHFANWLAVAALAVAGAGIWTFGDGHRTTEYEKLYYLLRVIIRYRLAIGIIAYGFIKFFPIQAPYPSLSTLNTPYGDFTRWKLFSLTLGIVPSYQSFLGLVEILSGLLLLSRKTASAGALVILFFTGNVFVSNLAYGGGEYVYSAYLLVFALFIIAYDIRRFSELFFFRRAISPRQFRPSFSVGGHRLRRVAKAGLLLFLIGYGFATWAGYRQGPYLFPRTAGLAGTAGLYNVRQFTINGDTISYSLTPSDRWRDVVFEPWSTISISTGKPSAIDRQSTEGPVTATSIDRTYEEQGTNGRFYFDYRADTLRHLITLRNKNPHFRNDSLVFSYVLDHTGSIVLRGLDQQGDSLDVVLDRIDKKYLLREAARKGRRGPLTL